ncbi:MAG: acetyl-CoA carboxylase biotin carboxyl carrier protein [Oscillospiraceae bacterium]|jgi:acetyl-CoA carboxylase biotin carboxyl carrier protein|nr:acetyl-CoA carboxylase biotin carboxyl carrier protein [Oscillospiraceae bacterium]
MSEMKLSVSEIKELMDKMAAAGLSGLQLRDGDFELSMAAEVTRAAEPFPVRPASRPAEAAPAPEDSVSGSLVTAPIVGTFYAAPSPEHPAFAPVGRQVSKGDVLFIIESMKLMNEVQSDYAGTVKKVFVENGQPVEYGQPIMLIE